MTFKETKFTKDNCFVALQYYGLILNRTYLVLLTSTSLVCVVANGLVAAEGDSGDFLTNAVISRLTIKGDLNNPLSYINSKYINKISNFSVESEDIISQNRASFKLNYDEIKEVRYDPKKKWGMGHYPHDGKVYLETIKGKRIEFIILGNQSGELIKNLILKRIQKVLL